MPGHTKGKLTAKQARFCREYIKDLNATQAAIRAGYSEENADVVGPRLVGKSWVASKIQSLMDKRAAALQIDAYTVIQELKRIALADPKQAWDCFGQVREISDMPEDIRRAVAGFEVKELFDGSGEARQAVGVIKKIKFWDKPKALETLARHLKLLTDKVEHSGTVSLEQLVGGAGREEGQSAEESDEGSSE